MKKSTSIMKAIITADDFGVSFGVNQAITNAYQNGILTSASIRTNGIAFEEAVKLSNTSLKKMGLGLHINLTDGVSHTGMRYLTFFQYFLLLLFPSNKMLSLIEREIEEQFLIVKRSKLRIDHVDGQDHIHMIPSILRIICRLCNKYKINYIRLVNEPFYISDFPHLTMKSIYTLGILKRIFLESLAKLNKSILEKYSINCPDAFYGVLYTNNMNETVVLDIIKDGKRRKFNTIEIASHPAILRHLKDKNYTSKFFARYGNMTNRKIETEALTSPKLKEFLKTKKVRLCTFAQGL